MDFAIRRAVTALTMGEDAERHFETAAQRIQHALLEVSMPSLDSLECGIHAEPARLVGGDYIDLYLCTPRSLVFALGDASGKSLAAAMTALMLRYLVRGLVKALGPDDLSLILRHVNDIVGEELDEGSFITFLIGRYDTTTCSLCVANAGHEPPVVLRKGSDKVELLEHHGIVLGVDPAPSFPQIETSLAPGDLLTVYTDGLTEATNERGELYTLARLARDLIAYRDRPAQAIADALFERVRAYALGELRDDATILVLRAR
ncbi:MAG TPA: PP2C family protein-serine/threonine phosphatase [Candidatus Acidoferrum sp.]|nr:PP2C family protein-serine/threonine phosphatase [Candidatus Acidoferrum sp.]